MGKEWYSAEDWYAPIESVPEKRRKRKEKRERKERISLEKLVTITVITLVVAAIAVTSVIFGVGNKDDVYFPDYNYDDPAEDAEDEMPDSFQEFFDNYYTSSSTDAAVVDIPAFNGKIIYRMDFTAHGDEELSLQGLYSECVETIVAITVYQKGDVSYGFGSGVIVSADGIIVTNTHVIDGSSKAVVTLYDGSEYEATLIGADTASDIAVIKIQATGLKTAEIGDSGLLSVGDDVCAIGNPLSENLKWTLTNGIISAISRGVNVEGRSMTLIQTNTALNSGNSGGALFNMYGQVVGITNMKMMSNTSSIEGIGFAIPTSTVKKVVNSLIEYGVVKGRTSIGITVGGDIPESVAELYSIPDGLYVSAVVENSDAYAKGIRVGDFIVAMNGQPVRTTEEVSAIKEPLSVGDTINMTVWRDGETFEVDVALMDTLDIYG